MLIIQVGASLESAWNT